MTDHLTDKIYAIFDGKDLNGLCSGLLSQQLKTWPRLRENYELLEKIMIRTISCNGFGVKIQHNPGRTISTLADTRPEAIDSRPCFLCINNLPELQKGILYRDFLILCNPAPVFHHHLTINSITHRPQMINTNIKSLLGLSKDLGHGWIALYNGPKCGASAPDHLHFQAIPCGNTPMEREINELKRPIESSGTPNVSIYYVDNLGRVYFFLEGYDTEALEDAFGKLLDAMRSVLKTPDEPMLNIACINRRDNTNLIVFPRAQHRPHAFFRHGDDRIAVSPAVIEMTGVIVTPLQRDFLKLDARTVESIYTEVSIDKKTMEAILGFMP